MNLGSPKELARALLAIEILFPEDDPRDPHGPPIEVPRRLGEAITTIIPDVVSRDATTLSESYGPDWRTMISDYEAICSSLKALSLTGRADRHALRCGESVLELLIERVGRDEEGARSMLDPNYSDVIESRERLGATTDQAFSDMQNSYFSYLCFRCARDALETLRDGIREINRGLDKDPPSKARR